MTKIVYKINQGFGECTEFWEKDAARCEIKFYGAPDGILTIGEKSIRTKEGAARLSLLSLPDGDYTPHLSCGAGVIPFSPIRKTGNNLTRPPISSEEFAHTVKKVCELQTIVQEIKKEIADIRQILSGSVLFG